MADLDEIEDPVEAEEPTEVENPENEAEDIPLLINNITDGDTIPLAETFARIITELESGQSNLQPDHRPRTAAKNRDEISERHGAEERFEDKRDVEISIGQEGQEY